MESPAPTTPVMDIAPPPQPVREAPPADAPDSAKKPALAVSKAPAKPAPKPAEPKSGVALAIVATVLIVLGLAALATYAYLKQNHSI